MEKTKLSISISISISLCFALCALSPHALYAAGMEDIQIIETSWDELVIRYQMPELEIDTRTVDGQTYQVLSFENCGFTQDVGKAQIPIRIVSLGIPDVSDPNVSAIRIGSSLHAVYKVYPM